MRTGHGVGSATATLGDGAAGVNVGDGDVGGIGRGGGLVGLVWVVDMAAGAAWRK